MGINSSENTNSNKEKNYLECHFPQTFIFAPKHYKIFALIPWNFNLFFLSNVEEVVKLQKSESF